MISESEKELALHYLDVAKEEFPNGDKYEIAGALGAFRAEGMLSPEATAWIIYKATGIVSAPKTLSSSEQAAWIKENLGIDVGIKK